MVRGVQPGSLEVVERSPGVLETAEFLLLDGSATRMPVRMQSAMTSLLGKIFVTFHNAAAIPVSFWWITIEGAEMHYGVLEPGASFKQQTFINHAWIFRDAATGRRMSVRGHSGQVFWPAADTEHIDIVEPPQLLWTKETHHYFPEEHRVAAKTLLLAHARLEQTAAWQPRTAPKPCVKPCPPVAAEDTAGPSAAADEKLPAAADAVIHTSCTEHDDGGCNGLETAQQDAAAPCAGAAQSCGPVIGHSSAVPADTPPQTHAQPGSTTACSSGVERGGTAASPAQPAATIAPVAGAGASSASCGAADPSSSCLEHRTALNGAISVLHDKESATAGAVDASTRTTDVSSAEHSGGQPRQRLARAMKPLKRLRQLMRRSEQQPASHRGSGTSRNAPLAAAPVAAAQKLPPHVDPAVPGPPGSASLGDLPQDLVIHMISLAAPEIWQDAQQPASAPDIAPFCLRVDPTNQRQIMMAAALA